MTIPSPALSRSRQRLFEAILIVVSLVIGYLLTEIGYRVYLFYSYAVKADYGVATIDVRPRPTGLREPGRVMGIYEPNTVFTLTQYGLEDQILNRHRVRINNLGWVSHYDYARAKPPGEVRIAVVGDSLTACINNEIPWPDVVQRRLNADPELLAALGAERITVLNFGMAGASMRMMANPQAVIARRFSPDLLVTNFVIEDLARRYGDDFETVPEEPATPPPDIASPPPAPDVTIDGVEINIYCPSGRLTTPPGPDCRISPFWYVPPDREIAGAPLTAIKQAAARQLLLHRVLLSPQPLALLELLGRPAVPRPQATTPAPAAAAGPDSAYEDEDVAVALRALRVIRRLHPHLLVTHNPLYWHLTGTVRPAMLDRFIARVAAEGFDIVQMEDHMPVQRGTPEWYRWYKLPHDGHWSDYGAEVYGEAMYRVIRSRLLAARGLAPAADGASCAAAFAHLHDGRTALALGAADAALVAFTAAVAALPATAAERARDATSYQDCGFLADLQSERAALLEGRGETAAAAADWQAALALVPDPAGLYRRRAELRQARGDTAAAVADLGAAIRLRPDDPALLLARGSMLLVAGETAAALADFSAGLALRPDDLTLRFQRGQARVLTGDHAGAVEDMDAALLLAPGNAGLLFLRAGAYAALGRLEAALADDTAAIAALPGQAAFHQARAALLDRLGRTAEAAADRTMAASLN